MEVSNKDLEKVAKLLRELVDLTTSLGLLPQAEATDSQNETPTKKTKKISASSVKDAKEVLFYYREIHPTKARGVVPGHEDFKMIRSRLAEYSVQELKRAIDANLKCEWHRSAKGGHSLKYIFRSDSKVENFLEEKKEAEPKMGHHPGSKEHHSGPQRFDID
tara:strand:+ start:127 stop:612 length:486 start_codon:yes stop_codon:yes gene_type:complete